VEGGGDKAGEATGRCVMPVLAFDCMLHFRLKFYLFITIKDGRRRGITQGEAT
jgi:hypothetical protein